MPTYGDNPAREYPYSPSKRKKQKYSMVTRVIDFANKPITSGGWPGHSARVSTTAWAASDVLQVIQIRAGQTVLGVQIEILSKSADSGDIIDVGYGDDADRWGRYNLYGTPGTTNEGMVQDYKHRHYTPEQFFDPHYFASTDTIDITIRKAALAGKVRLIVHLLQDDR